MANLIASIKQVVKRTPLFKWYARARRAYHERGEYRQWVKTGRPIPPPHLVKRRTVTEYANGYGLHTFVETGTCFGDMVNGIADVFETIYSIELSLDLYQHSRERFAAKPHITILQGDSGEILGQVLTTVKTPCLFWLDGHYSEGVTAKGATNTPIQRELGTILEHPLHRNHVILIDDARDFTGQHDYPTIQALQEWAHSAGYEVFEVKDDIIRIHNSHVFDKLGGS